MITTERTGDALWIFDGAHKHYIEVVEGCADIRVCDHRSHGVEAACMDVDDAVAMLRAMLREIVGPSIDDVREVWESPRATSVHDTDHGLSAQPWHVRVPHPEGGSMIFGGATEREALQAAYDAGVARAKAATVPPS